MRKLLSSLVLLIALLLVRPGWAQHSNNAALQYYAAFFQMVDADLSESEIKEIGEILSGTQPYDDARFGKLAESNADAIETMMLGASFPDCDWGLAARSEKFGWQTPVAYFWKSRALGRLDILYVLHAWAKGDQDKSVNALAKGMVFARHVSSGGPLVAALIANQLLMQQFVVAGRFAGSGKLTSTQKQVLRTALAGLGANPIDWQAAVNTEMRGVKVNLDLMRVASDPRQYYKLVFNKDAPSDFHGITQRDYADSEMITAAYATLFRDDSAAVVHRAISAATEVVQQMIPAPDNLMKARQLFQKALEEIRARFQSTSVLDGKIGI